MKKIILWVYQCDHCEYTSKDISEMRQHEATHKDELCDTCDEDNECSGDCAGR